MPDKRPRQDNKPKIDPHHGEMQPVKYPDNPGKRLGNWLYLLVTGRL